MNNQKVIDVLNGLLSILNEGQAMTIQAQKASILVIELKKDTSNETHCDDCRTIVNKDDSITWDCCSCCLYYGVNK